jgi:hypothetical protein
MRLLPILLICPSMTGCLAYGYPSITQTPPVHVMDPDVKAFRVTADLTIGGFMIAGYFLPGDSVDEIQIIDGVVPSQHDAHFAYDYTIFPVAGNRRRTITVCLYRRGYETVRVESRCCLAEWWCKQTREISWKKAETLEAREKAIDDLNPRFGICPTAVSAFLVDEYVALAAVARDDSTRKKLQEKAERTLGATAFYK